MKDCYKLNNPQRNPYAERMKNDYSIIIGRTPSDNGIESHAITSEENRHKDIANPNHTLTQTPKYSTRH